MTQLLRTSPGLLAWIGIFGITALVLLVLGGLMSRSGASLRSLYWFAGLMLLIGAPQFLAHLYFAVAALQEEAPRRAALSSLSTASDRDLRSQSAKLLFGPDADPDLIVDAKKLFTEPLGKAIQAQFASFGTGETVLLAQFAGYSDAEKAWVAYLQHTGLASLGGKGDSQRGYAATRPVGDRAYALHLANMLGVWTGPDDSTIRRRMSAAGFDIPRRAPLAELAVSEAANSSATPGSPSQLGSRPLSAGMMGLGLAGYLFVVVLYFFKGAAWAGSSPAKTATRPIPAGELAARLAAVNTLDVPIQVQSGPDGNELNATWRYADAKWIGLARAHGLRRTHRIRMVLDEPNRTVRVTDYSARFDWAAGQSGATVQWQSSLGIQFFHYEHQRVFGLQLDEQGRFKPALSYAYTFNLNEIKAPLIQAVTEAGWHWRPVVWSGPPWLRWLTG